MNQDAVFHVPRSRNTHYRRRVEIRLAEAKTVPDAVRPILEAAAAKHKVPVEALWSPTRLRQVVCARLQAAWALRDRGWSIARVARLFNRDPTTVSLLLRTHARDA